MQYKQNLHTHSTFCDGNNTPRELVLAAIDKGFDSLGFSSHSYTYFDESYCMNKGAQEKYSEEIDALKKEFAGKIDILLGLELDMLASVETSRFDYLIGSAHYLKYGDEILDIDCSKADLLKIAEKYFGGNCESLAKAYFNQLCALSDCGKIDIIGHFDLISKSYDDGSIFDVNSKIYVNSAIEAIESLCGKIPYFEINAGGMAKGYHNSFYPDKKLIKEFLSRGFGAVITSDCHDKNKLDFGFEDAKTLLKECGFKEAFVLKTSGFEPVLL